MTARRRPTRCSRPPRPGTWGSDVTPAAVVRRILFSRLITLLSPFFALPLLWLVFAPFDVTHVVREAPGLHPRQPRRARQEPLCVVVAEELDVHRGRNDAAGDRSRGAGRLCALAGAHARPRPMLYALLLLSSIVTGTAAMVPIFLLMFQLGLIDSRSGVSLVLAGGLLPAAIFILKDFMDATPHSYEESARGSAPARCRCCATSCCRSRDPASRPSRCGPWSTPGVTSSSPTFCCATRRRHPPAC